MEVKHLMLDVKPVDGVPNGLRMEIGGRRALVIPDPEQARAVADLVVGLADPAPGTMIRRPGTVRLVPAEGGLLPYLTVLENLVHARCATRRLPRHRATDACRNTARWCGLDAIVDRYPYEITPGRRRLAGVARALCTDPDLVVLEDASGLPTWGSLLDFQRTPQLADAALLLITPDPQRAAEFDGAEHA